MWYYLKRWGMPKMWIQKIIDISIKKHSPFWRVLVLLISEWSNTSFTTGNGTPCSISLVATVCLKS